MRTVAVRQPSQRTSSKQSVLPPTSRWIHPHHQLQRTIGNRAVQQLFQAGAHVQQAHQPRQTIQREAAQPSAAQQQVTGPLTDREWELVELWQSRGQVGTDPLTEDAAQNALLIAGSLFCSRMLATLVSPESREDPLLCIDDEITHADPRVQQIVPHVTARGPIINWSRVPRDQRILHVMEALVDEYGYPRNGAAGLVGNLMAESGVLPTKIERSGRPSRDEVTPLTERDFAGREQDFTAEEVMNRDPARRRGPRKPGIGLAQWTTEPRRSGLFQHTYQGRQQGASILFNMDAQIDYLVSELRSRYAGVNAVISGGGVSIDAASDEVVYRFEVPGRVLYANGTLRPRTDPQVQAVFVARRANAHRAFRIYDTAHPTAAR